MQEEEEEKEQEKEKEDGGGRRKRSRRRNKDDERLLDEEEEEAASSSTSKRACRRDYPKRGRSRSRGKKRKVDMCTPEAWRESSKWFSSLLLLSSCLLARSRPSFVIATASLPH